MKNSETTIAQHPDATILSPGLEEQIRSRAYQLYEERGKIDGHDAEDWMRAEAEILTHKVMRKAA